MLYSIRINSNEETPAPIAVTATKKPIPNFMNRKSNKITIKLYDTDDPRGTNVAVWEEKNVYSIANSEKDAVKDLVKKISFITGQSVKDVVSNISVTRADDFAIDPVDDDPDAIDDAIDNALNNPSIEPTDDFIEEPEEDVQQPIDEIEPESEPAQEQEPNDDYQAETDQIVDDSQASPDAVPALLKILSLVALRIRGITTSKFAKAIVEENYSSAHIFIESVGGSIDEFRNMLANYGSSDIRQLAVVFGKNFRKIIKNERTFSDITFVSPKFRDMLDPVLSAVINPDSNNQMGLIAKRISVLKDRNLEKEYANFIMGITNETQDLKQEISNIVKQFGSGAKALTQEEINKLKDSNPEELKRYRKARADYSKRITAEYKSIVLNSGKEFLPMNIFIKKCKELGLPVDNHNPVLWNTNMIGINTSANYTDRFGNIVISQSTGKAAGINPLFKLEINPSYIPNGGRGKNWVLKTTSDLGVTNYLFTKVYVAESVENKFTKVSDAIENIDTAKRSCRQDVLGEDDDNSPSKVYSMILEFMYITTCRPGAKVGQTAGNRTYGAMNFLVQHVKPVGASGLVLKFPIKSGKIETYYLDPKAVTNEDKRAMTKLVEFIKVKMKGKKQDDIVFTIDGKRGDPNRLNTYIHTIGLPITSHKIRTVRGTILAKELLEPLLKDIVQKERKSPFTDKQVQDMFKEKMVEVGSLLAHVRRTKDGQENATWITAAKAYVDTSYTMNWFARAKHRPPRELVDAASVREKD